MYLLNKTRLLRRLEDAESHTTSGSVVTLGNFDGMHLGHQALLRQTIAIKKKWGLSAVMIVFHPHPVEFFSKKKIHHLMDLREKYTIAQAFGFDVLCCIAFNHTLVNLSASDFIAQLMHCVHMRHMVVGYDVHFGYQRIGNAEWLTQYALHAPLDVQIVSALCSKRIPISSSRIRHILQSGQIEEATALLSRPFRLRGRVVHGRKRGGSTGYPTANVHLKRHTIPISGVFVVRVLYDQKMYNGVANLGLRPTFLEQELTLEVHLLDVCLDLYGAYLTVEFLHQLRSEMRFQCVDDLIAQITCDITKARLWLNSSLKEIKSHPE